MTPAEFKCALDYLGVSTAWFAERTGKGQRSVVRWCDGDAPVPREMAWEMAQILLHTAATYDTLRENLVIEDGIVVLRTYRTDHAFWASLSDDGYPASWHRQLTARLAFDLAAEHVTRIEYVQ